MNNKTKWKSHQLFLWWNDVANLICIVKIWIISPHAKYDIYQNKLVFSSTVNREFAVFNSFFLTRQTHLLLLLFIDMLIVYDWILYNVLTNHVINQQPIFHIAGLAITRALISSINHHPYKWTHTTYHINIK